MEIKLWNIPPSEYTTLKEAFECGNYLFLIVKWNEYKVTDAPLCSGCPNTIETIEHYYPKYFQIIENQ